MLCPNLGHRVFLEVLALLHVRHCVKLQSVAISSKLKSCKLEKMAKNVISGPIPGLQKTLFFKGFTSTGSYTLFQAFSLSNCKEH